MAKYKPGECGNPVGRPKGAQNKDMIELRAWIKNFTERNAGQIERDFKKLKPAERCTLINRNGTVVVPLVLDEVKPFKEGYASVKRLGRWTIINSMGNEVGKDIEAEERETDDRKFRGMRRLERGVPAGQFLGVD